jgi:ATP-binding cassette subfamily B protein
VAGTGKREGFTLLRKFRDVLHRPKLLLCMCALQIIMAFLQSALIGMLLPVFRSLLRPEPDFAAAAPWLITGAIGLLVYLTLKLISTTLAFSASMDVTAQIRRKIIEHVARLSPGWFNADHKARLAHTITADSAAAGTLSVTFGAQIINEIFAPAALGVFALFINRQAALPLVCGIPVLILCVKSMSRRYSYIEEELAAATREIAGKAVEFGRAQPLLRAAGRESRADSRMRQAIDEHRRLFQKGLNTSILPHLGCMAVPVCAFIMTFIIGIHLLIDGGLPLADAIVLFIIAARYVQPLGSAVEKSSVLDAISNSLGRIREILHAPALTNRREPVTVMKSAEIEFCDVTFAYNSDDNPVLRNVSFVCPPGSATALIGASGAGKTTITKLIARFFDVNTGSVRIGGVDVRDYDHASLLKNIAVIFQDVYLFDGTIEENLLLVRPAAAKEQLESAARSARLDEVIERLPDGWRTRVGEAGAMLSGGERQRVSIARAFLKDAPIVLIDEAVSALDPQNERAIGDAIADLAGSPARTVIIIAHHPAILAAADRVVALDGGRVAETGTPDELLRSGGILANLYKQYKRTRGWRINKRA